MKRDEAVLFINGKRHEIKGKHAFMMLSDYLRYEAGLTGTKIVCAEGDCGACTVLCATEQKEEEPEYVPINSCIAMTAQLDGCHIVTVEGLADNGKLSPVQESLALNHASQCGFCTPGFACALTAMFERDSEDLSAQKVKNCLTGNLCRCTGYLPIIEAAQKVDSSFYVPLKSRYKTPKEEGEAAKNLDIEEAQRSFFAPTKMSDALMFKSQYKDATIIAGTTDIGVLLNKGAMSCNKWLSLQKIPELARIEVKDNVFVVGARVTLCQFESFCETRLPELAKFLHIFASPQIKNQATLIGNLVNASPIGDMIPAMFTLDATLHFASEQGTRETPIRSFYEGYKKSALQKDEIVTHVSFAVPKGNSIFKCYKVSKRRDLDISTVNASFRMEMAKDGKTIQEARVAFGGVGPTVLECKDLENHLRGQEISGIDHAQAASIALKSLSPISDMRGSEVYRRMIVENLVQKFFTVDAV